MIRILGKIPKEICVAVSGGSDSMAVLDFLSRKKKTIAIHYNHDYNHGLSNNYGNQAQDLVKDFCKERNIDFYTEKNTTTRNKKESLEEYWRRIRYNFFERQYSKHKLPIVTCHHLDDAVETWIFSSLHGNPNLIPYKRDHYVRPFLITRKERLTEWCWKNNVPYIDDPSNREVVHMRNYIRLTLLPKILRINPGIHKTILKKYIKTKTNENFKP